jgi:hypothetical protein
MEHEGTPIRFPAIAELEVDSLDRYLSPFPAAPTPSTNILFPARQSLMLGYFTRIALSELQLFYNCPNITPRNNTISWIARTGVSPYTWTAYRNIPITPDVNQAQWADLSGVLHMAVDAMNTAEGGTPYQAVIRTQPYNPAVSYGVIERTDGDEFDFLGRTNQSFRFSYLADTVNVAAPPNDGFITWDDANQLISAVLNINTTDSSGNSTNPLIQDLLLGDEIILRDSANPENYQRWAVQARPELNPIAPPPDYYEVPVALITANPPGFQFVNNQRMTVEVKFLSDEQTTQKFFKTCGFTQFGLGYSVDTEQVLVYSGASLAYTRYIDFDSDVLAKFAKVKDGMTRQLQGQTNVLARVYLTAFNTKEKTYIATEPFSIAVDYSTPKNIRWNPMEYLNDFDITLRDEYGDELYWSPEYSTEYQLTIQVSET